MIEVLVVIVIIAYLAMLMIPPLSASKGWAQRRKCASNLKQVGEAFRIFAGDNNGNYPFAARNSIAFQKTTNAWMHFEAMSNRLVSAKILMCPADRERLNTEARDFFNGSTGLMDPQRQDLSLSYFVGLGARQARPQSVLSGDRNMARSKSDAVYSSSTNGRAIEVTSTSIWLRGAMHHEEGNILLSDGSVKLAITGRQLGGQLQAATNLYGVSNNYFLFPQ